MEISTDYPVHAPVGAGGGSSPASPPPDFGPRSFGSEEWREAFEAFDEGKYGYTTYFKAGSHVGASKQLFAYHYAKYKKSGDLPRGRYGPDPRLTVEFEEKLVEFILLCSESLMPVSPQTVRMKARDIAESIGLPPDSVGGDAWFKAFKSRHPELSTRMPQEIEVARITATTSKNLEGFFTNLKCVLVRYTSVPDTTAVDPDKIWNMDESAVGLRGTRAPVSVGRGCARRTRHATHTSYVSLPTSCRSFAPADIPRTSARRRRATTSPSSRAATRPDVSSVLPSFSRASAPWGRTWVGGRRLRSP